MPTYCFTCPGRDHPEGTDRDFVQMIHHVPKKVITTTNCPDCGAVAKRALEKEIPTQHLVGVIPISHSTTGKGSLASETQFAFGKFKRNPDGSVDKNHAAFRDSGEMDKYMSGQNEIGEPVLDDSGEPVRRKDGSMVRRGAKLFKYDKNATPRGPRGGAAPRRKGAGGWAGVGAKPPGDYQNVSHKPKIY